MKKSTIFWIVALPTMLVVQAMMNDKSGSSTRVEDDSTMAGVHCQAFVKQQLTNPSQADFPFLDQRSTKVADGHYIIESYVDAKNAFGGQVRSNYFCEVKWNGRERGDRGNWALMNLRLAN